MFKNINDLIKIIYYQKNYYYLSVPYDYVIGNYWPHFAKVIECLLILFYWLCFWIYICFWIYCVSGFYRMDLMCFTHQLTYLLFLLNPLQPGVASLYPLKTSDNLRISGVFRGYRKATPDCNGLILMSRRIHLIQKFVVFKKW